MAILVISFAGFDFMKIFYFVVNGIIAWSIPSLNYPFKIEFRGTRKKNMRNWFCFYFYVGNRILFHHRRQSTIKTESSNQHSMLFLIYVFFYVVHLSAYNRLQQPYWDNLVFIYKTNEYTFPDTYHYVIDWMCMRLYTSHR